MKVLQVHNMYRFRGGEDAVVEATTALLRRNGVEVALALRQSAGLDKNLAMKFRAFVSGVYSPSGRRFLETVMDRESPDVVHVHNLFPLFSPFALLSCSRRGIPVVMTCHNYRLLCPTGLFLREGKICDDLCTGREYRCLLNNCRGNLLESGAYAIRSALARRYRVFDRNVTLFIALTRFAKNVFSCGGIPEGKIAILPNYVPSGSNVPMANGTGEYIAYAGRITPEKGVETLINAARITGLPVRLAGDPVPTTGVMGSQLPNVIYLGFIEQPRLAEFYGNARFLVFPSIWNEMFPLTLLEAMKAGLPILCSRIGGLPEIVHDGVTGLLFDPGNASDLAFKMKKLWEDPALCSRMGKASREIFEREYSDSVHFRGLMAVYERAIAVNREKVERHSLAC